jgi:hypothetical protein
MKSQAKPTRRRVLLVIGGVMLLALGSVALFIYFLFPSVDDLCANDNLVETVSPNGQLKAVTFRRDCGATTAYSTHVSILPVSHRLPNEAGNVFVQSREPIVVVWWLDDHHLSISGGGASTAFVHHTDFRGVRITYD